MRTEDQVRSRLKRLGELRDKAPIDVTVRAELGVRIDELQRVLEQWPYRHAFEPWADKGIRRERPWCALCGRDKDDILHSDEEDGGDA